MGRLGIACVVLCTSLGAACTHEYTGTGQDERSGEAGALDSGSPGDTPMRGAEDASLGGADAYEIIVTNGDAGDARDAELDGGDAHVDAGPPNPCDLKGRWLIVTRVVSTGLGGRQNIYRLLYYELAGTGESFSVTKGLACGDGVDGFGIASVSVRFDGAQLATMMKTNYTSRTLTSVPRANGCNVTMEKWYTVQGASLPYYLDPTTTLPTLDEQATASKPGWEDWDADGNPGITGVINGMILGLNVTGEVYAAARQWNAMADTVSDVSKSFVAHVTWGVEQDVISARGAGVLSTAQVVPVADPTLHIAEFVRLGPDQAVGDDATICAAIRELAPTLATTAKPPP